MYPTTEPYEVRQFKVYPRKGTFISFYSVRSVFGYITTAYLQKEGAVSKPLVVVYMVLKKTEITENYNCICFIWLISLPKPIYLMDCLESCKIYSLGGGGYWRSKYLTFRKHLQQHYLNCVPIFQREAQKNGQKMESALCAYLSNSALCFCK